VHCGSATHKLVWTGCVCVCVWGGGNNEEESDASIVLVSCVQCIGVSKFQGVWIVLCKKVEVGPLGLPLKCRRAGGTGQGGRGLE